MKTKAEMKTGKQKRKKLLTYWKKTNKLGREREREDGEGQLRYSNVTKCENGIEDTVSI